MSVMRGLRAYHALLALLVVAAYLTGEVGTVHALLGYAIAAIAALRMLAALSGVRPLGLERFYPKFEGLRVGNAFTHPAVSRTLLAGIAACLLAATLSGIALDRGRTVGLAAGGQAVVAARSDEHRPERAHPGREREDGGGVLGEAHEAVSDLLVLVVGLHVAYLLAFKRPLARFMLFLDGGETARTPGKPALTTGPAGPAGVR